jgi:anthranilate synthase component 2
MNRVDCFCRNIFDAYTRFSGMQRILVFDNYDSFTYNLVHLAGSVSGYEVTVVRNDRFELDRVMAFDKIILSPGPGIPSEAGLLMPLLRQYASVKSILGVCLGHQAIAEHFGARLVNLPEVYHGVAEPVRILPGRSDLYLGMADGFEAGRYHSWAVDREHLPDCLEITAEDTNGLIMGLRHRQYDVEGVQFHPESILTPTGGQLMRNWLMRSMPKK